MAHRVKELSFGEKWTITLPGNERSCVKHAVEHWIKIANTSVDKHGIFSCALSGGSTPVPIYQELNQKTNRDKIPWDKVYLFWSDERNVPPNHAESNYRLAMEEGGFNELDLKKEQVFRMVAEDNLEANALLYEEQIKTALNNRPIDLMMLGMGNDGHTASLFPHTDALHVTKRLVVPNYIPALKKYRMTLTFDCINRSPHIFVYVFGQNKQEILENVFLSQYTPDEFPIQRIGSPKNKATFIVDDEASRSILSHLQ